jgi:hypothetical protein
VGANEAARLYCCLLLWVQRDGLRCGRMGGGWAKEAALRRICLRRWVQAQEAALLQPAAVDVGEGGFAVACCGGLQQLVLPSLALCKDSRRSLLEDTKGLGSGANTAPAMRPALQFRCS